MRFFKVMAAPLAILLLSLVGCGGGGGGGSTPAPTGDTVAPTVSITAPARVSGITTVSVSASDNVGVTKVEFYVNNDLQGTLTSAPYNFNWDISLLSKGSYTLSAKAYDAANNMGQAANMAVTVPIAVSMSTVISGSTAVGTVFLAGLPTPDAFGLELNFTMPTTASMATASPSGVAANGFSSAPGPFLSLASSNGFGSGEVLRISFDNVPAGAVPADFGISLSAVFGAGGVQIQ